MSRIISGERYFRMYQPLQRAALDGDWEAAFLILNLDRSLATASITKRGETILHVAAGEGHGKFINHLLDYLSDEDLSIMNNKGWTALSFAVHGGHLDVVRLLLQRKPDLAQVAYHEDVTPLLLASKGGCREMVELLFPLSNIILGWTRKQRAELLTALLESRLYEIARKTLFYDPELAVYENTSSETPLHVLARMPSAFAWKGGWMTFRSSDRERAAATSDARTLLMSLWDIVKHMDNVGSFTGAVVPTILFRAVEAGNYDFVVDLVRRIPDCLYIVNDQNHSMFHVAVLHRHLQIFNLIYERRSVKNMVVELVDERGNNLLHLAAMSIKKDGFSKSKHFPLLVQRDVLWYQEVKRIVPTGFEGMINVDGQTPVQVFLTNHKETMAGEAKLMKKIADSCLIVTILIVTAIFTSVFTVPSGFNSAGVPAWSDHQVYLAFPSLQAIGTLLSLIAMSCFIWVQSSPYSKINDFRKLPFLLGVGLVALLLDTIALTTLFCFAIMYFRHMIGLLVFLILFFCIIPFALFYLGWGILFTIMRSLSLSRFLFKSNNILYKKF